MQPQKKNIPIFNTPGANARAVAELNFLLVLMSARNIPAIIGDAKDGIWKARAGNEVENKTLGIIGAGPIAQYISKMGNAFGMKVIYWTRSGETKNMMGTYKKFDDVISNADFLSLSVPKEAGTIIDAAALNKMKQTAMIINTAPAELVDADALHDALSNDKIKSAAFDCFYAEGEEAWKCPQAKLLDLDKSKFFITPHVGWQTQEASDNMFRMVIDYTEGL